jgi:hypothetical protein
MQFVHVYINHGLLTEANVMILNGVGCRWLLLITCYIDDKPTDALRGGLWEVEMSCAEQSNQGTPGSLLKTCTKKNYFFIKCFI